MCIRDSHNKVRNHVYLLLPCSAPASTSLALAVLLLVKTMTGFFVSCPGWVGKTSLDSAPACSHHAWSGVLVAEWTAKHRHTKGLHAYSLGHSRLTASDLPSACDSCCQADSVPLRGLMHIWAVDDNTESAKHVIDVSLKLTIPCIDC